MARKKVRSKKTNTKNNKKSFLDIVIRYIILIAVAFPGLLIFYKIFTPLTVYSVHFIFSLFYNSSITSSTDLLVNNVPIELIRACIAGSAYYLLLIFNLSTPGIKFGRRIKAILFSFVAFLILNILRIVLLGNLAISGSSYFDVTHALFWYGISTFIVVGIWFFEVKIFRIKDIPLYSDLKAIYRASHFGK